MTAKLTLRIRLISQRILKTPFVADTTSAPPSIATVGSQKEKGQCVKLGFVEKMSELWRLRRRILEDKPENLVSGFLTRHNHEAGKAIMNKTLTYKSSYMMKVFKARNKALTMEERSRASLAMYNNQIVQYKALLLQCEKDYDLMINTRLYQEIVVPYFNLKHGQFAAVALTRSGANKVLKRCGKRSSHEKIAWVLG